MPCNRHPGQGAGARIDVGRHREVDDQQLLTLGETVADGGDPLAIEEGLVRRGHGDDRADRGRCLDRFLEVHGLSVGVIGHHLQRPCGCSVGDNHPSVGVPGPHQPQRLPRHFSRPENQNLAIRGREVFVQGSLDQGHQGHRPPRQFGLGPDPLGEMERLVKSLIEDTAEKPRLVRDLVGLFGLARDLGLTNHHRIEGRGDAKEVADRGSTEVDVEGVVVGKLAPTVREIGQGPSEVKQQRVGMDASVAAEVELDAVAGAEIDELGKAREARQLDEVFTRKITGKRGRCQCLDGDGPIGCSDNTDPIQYSLPRAILRESAPTMRHAGVKPAHGGTNCSLEGVVPVVWHGFARSPPPRH